MTGQTTTVTAVYTREQVDAAAGAAAGLVAEYLSAGEDSADQRAVNESLTGLVAAVTGELLDRPGLTLDEAITAAYGADPDTVKGQLWLPARPATRGGRPG